MADCCGTNNKHQEVAEYYGKTLTSSKDLKTSCCTTAGTGMTTSVKLARSLVHDEVLSSFYGCGSPVPPAIEGCVVLDLGCGSGADVYTCSKLVGETGKVIGIDMTADQLEKARKYIDHHTSSFGYSKPNVEFIQGVIEDLKEIKDASVDLIISNCVINLCPNKSKVFQECFRVLKQGGEFYFSDVYADRRIPKELQEDTVLWGECISGALYEQDFIRQMRKVGFEDPRVVTSTLIDINNPELSAKVKSIKFYSKTYRAFKLDTLEDKCEDFGQTATYTGGITDHPHAFYLDDHHCFVTGHPLAVCGNSADMVALTRYSKYFKVTPRAEHRGLFDCSGSTACVGGACC